MIRNIEVSTKSEILANHLHLLLLNLGIISRLRKCYNKKYHQNYYKLTMFGKNIDIYARMVGIISQRKKKILSLMVGHQTNVNKDVIPYQSKNIKKYLIEHRRLLPFGKQNSKKIGRYWKGFRNLTYETLEWFLKKSVIKKGNLHKLFKLNYYYDTISRINR